MERRRPPMATLEYELEGELEEEAFGSLPVGPAGMRQVAAACRRAALSRGLATLPHPEAEWELEGESEAELLVNPIRRVYPDAMMEHFGHAAAEARSEAEAEAFIGALIPLAARLLPRVAPVIMRSAPGL